MKIVTTEFITGAVSPQQYPKGVLPEFAFAGRSNVGKSSLIRSLLNRKKLVHISATPGKTQQINFFRVNENLMFADLPGYGFAKVPLSVKRKWQKMVEQYLLKRNSLAAVVFIVDLRRDPTALDLELKEWMDAYRIPYLVVATKADKVSRGARKKHVDKIRAAFLNPGDELVVYSSETQEGRKELWRRLRQRAESKKEGSGEGPAGESARPKRSPPR